MPAIYYETRLMLLEEKRQKTAHTVAGIEGLIDHCTNCETYRVLFAARNELIDKLGMIAHEQLQLQKPPLNDNQAKTAGSVQGEQY